MKLWKVGERGGVPRRALSPLEVSLKRDQRGNWKAERTVKSKFHLEYRRREKKTKQTSVKVFNVPSPLLGDSFAKEKRPGSGFIIR